VLGSATVPIRSDDTLGSLTARMRRAEHELLVDTLATLCRQEVGP
jgi:folate-dependent phosphoribosylglycinamide formyltransferase PurN